MLPTQRAVPVRGSKVQGLGAIDRQLGGGPATVFSPHPIVTPHPIGSPVVPARAPRGAGTGLADVLQTVVLYSWVRITLGAAAGVAPPGGCGGAPVGEDGECETSRIGAPTSVRMTSESGSTLRRVGPQIPHWAG